MCRDELIVAFREFLGPVVWNSYVSHVDAQHMVRMPLEDWLRVIKPKCWLPFAFTWDTTCEGYKFWYDLDGEWRRYLSGIVYE